MIYNSFLYFVYSYLFFCPNFNEIIIYIFKKKKKEEIGGGNFSLKYRF